MGMDGDEPQDGPLRANALRELRSAKQNIDNVITVLRDEEASVAHLATAINDIRGVSRCMISVAGALDRVASDGANKHIGALPEGDDEK